MVDITIVPDGELRYDLAETEQDIEICLFALASGMTHHKDGFPVRERLEINQKIAAKIKDEMVQRGMTLKEYGEKP